MAEHGFALPRTGPQDTKAGNPERLGWVREGRAAGAGEGDARGWRSEVAPNRWGAEGPGRGGGSRERKTVRAPAETGRRGPGAGARTPAEARRLGAEARGRGRGRPPHLGQRNCAPCRCRRPARSGRPGPLTSRVRAESRFETELVAASRSRLF